MARRKTVAINTENAEKAIKAVFRHNVVFCEKMDRHATWVSDWKRTPAKNLPSPEEAAKICSMLNVDPAEILVASDDIQLVARIIKESETALPSAKSEEEDDPEIDMVYKLLQKLPEDARQGIIDDIKRKALEYLANS